MKNVFILVFIAIFVAQCVQNADYKTEETTARATTYEVLEEELRPYALTILDSVYSVRAHFKSADSAVVVYAVHLIQGDQTYADSLILSIPAGEVVQGELIFPACRVKNRPLPTFTSKINQIEN